MAGEVNRFDEFVIESMIGEGGMGKVYRARQTALDRWVALKVLPRAKENRSFIERFYREARSAARLVHPNIIQIHTVGEVQGVPYYTMEYVEGDDLEHVIRNRQSPLTQDELVEIARSVMKALAIASEQGVVHRDIKPANIMISKTGLVKVMDFGLAKELDHNITQSGVVVGTPTYMSPEQGGGQTVDFRADLYSMGCVLFECIWGNPPFQAEKVASVIYKHMFEPVPPVSDATHPVDPGLEAFILRSLEKKPDSRFTTPADALQALSKLTHNSAAAEISLGLRALHSLKLKKTASQAAVKLPDMAKLAGPRPGQASKTNIPKRANDSRPPGALPPVQIPSARPGAGLDKLVNAKPAERLPTEKLGRLPTEKVAKLPTEKVAKLPTEKVGFLRSDRPPAPGLPGPDRDAGRDRLATPLGQQRPADVHTTPIDGPSRPVPKPLNMLKPPPKKESSGLLVSGGTRPPSINIQPPSRILEEAEVSQKRPSQPVMRVQRQGTVSPIFTKLPDGRWSYSRGTNRCDCAEGLAQKLPPVPPGSPGGGSDDSGLRDCLLCPNWNKRTGCAVAFCEELTVKGRFSGLKLLTEQAVAWMGAGRFDRAIVLLNEFVEDNPDNPDGCRELARIYDRPDYHGRDKRRGIIMYTRFVELAKTIGGYSQIEIGRAEARAAAMKTMLAATGTMPVGETLDFDCFYRGGIECFACCRAAVDSVLVMRAGAVDPETGVSEPDPSAGVSAFRSVRSIFTRSRTEQEKQEEQSAVRKELQRLRNLDTALLVNDPAFCCKIDLDAVTGVEFQIRPPDLTVLKVKEKNQIHTLLFASASTFECQQFREFMTRRLSQVPKRVTTGRYV